MYTDLLYKTDKQELYIQMRFKCRMWSWKQNVILLSIWGFMHSGVYEIEDEILD